MYPLTTMLLDRTLGRRCSWRAAQPNAAGALPARRPNVVRWHPAEQTTGHALLPRAPPIPFVIRRKLGQ